MSRHVCARPVNPLSLVPKSILPLHPQPHKNGDNDGSSQEGVVGHQCRDVLWRAVGGEDVARDEAGCIAEEGDEGNVANELSG